MRGMIVAAGAFVALGWGQAEAQVQSADPAPAPRPVIVAAGKARAATPIGNPATWVTRADYPPEALREQREGVVGFRLEIGPNGRVTACEVTFSSGYAPLDEATCRLLSERAIFNPG
ncbi:MAG: TonB family protein, partial [Sphingomonadaceae bacterium]|nr:TonB family protein [Sphingomonadaceae bacterium]